MNVSTVLGIIVGLATLIGGIVLKGSSLSALANPAALVIIFVGTFAALLNAFPMSTIAKLPTYFGLIFGSSKQPEEMELAKEFITANAPLYELAVKSMGLGRLDAILGDYQQRWDADEAFDLSKIGMLNAFDPEAWKRKPDNEAAELTACLSEIASKVEKELLDALEPSYINGLSLLGGEPFEPENQKALVPFLRKVKERYPGKNIWCYSGYLYDSQLLSESRARCGYTDEMLSMIDVLVDGRFVKSLKDITLVFRGSSNQRIIDVKKSLESGDVVLWESRIKRGI